MPLHTPESKTLASFAESWSAGYDSVWLFRFLGAQPHRASQGPLIQRWLAVSLGPFALGIAVIAITPGGSLSAIPPLFLMALLTLGAYAAAVLAWRHVMDDAELIDSLLQATLCSDANCYVCGKIAVALSSDTDGAKEDISSEDIRVAATHRVLRYVTTAYVPAVQLAWAFGTVVIVAIPATIASAGQPQIERITFVALVGYMGATVGSVLLWLVVTPTVVLQLNRSGHLNWRILDPARTPGIRALASGYMYSAIFVGLAALAVVAPTIFGYDFLATTVPVGLSQIPVLSLLFALFLGLAVWVGASTQFRLSHLVRQVRLQTMDYLSGDPSLPLSRRRYVLPSQVNLAVKRLDETSLLQLYGSVGTAPNLPYGTVVVVEYIGVLFGALIAYLIGASGT